MGNTALHFAVAQGNSQLVEVLLSKGASKRIKNHYAQGITPTQVSRHVDQTYFSRNFIDSIFHKNSIL